MCRKVIPHVLALLRLGSLCLVGADVAIAAVEGSAVAGMVQEPLMWSSPREIKRFRLIAATRWRSHRLFLAVPR